MKTQTQDNTKTNCFKAYDVRGKIPEEFNSQIAYDIARAYVAIYNPDWVIIGRDVRHESDEIAKKVAQGLTDSGVRVFDIGLCGTEEIYFHTFSSHDAGRGGGIMVTASHNPKGYNGLKLVGDKAKPLSEQEIKTIEQYVINKQFVDAEKKGKLLYSNCRSGYIQHLREYIDKDNVRTLKIVANPGNGPAGIIIDELENRLPYIFHKILDEPNGDFPSGIPNPMLLENRELTSKAVLEYGADLGIAWDGDFDRCFFFDEKGQFIEGYYIVGLLAETILKNNRSAKIVHDSRLKWNTLDIVNKYGGEAIESKTGHNFIKQQMRQNNASYGGEMSAHHYFKDFGYCDSGMIPWILITNLLSVSNKTLSEMVSDYKDKYPCFPETNFKINDAEALFVELEKYYKETAVSSDRFDGLSMVFENWRFNIRSSNTEPLVRLNIETQGDKGFLEIKLSEIKEIITKNQKN